jgi:hypothetical protein
VNLSSTFNNQSSSEGSFQFLGTEGSLTVGDGLTFRAENAVEDNRWIVDSWPSQLEEAYYKDPKVRQAELPESWPQKTVAATEQYRQQGIDTTVPHMANWLASIRTRKPYWEDASAGHRAAACAHMINRSAKERRMVEWDYSKDDVRA